MSLSQDFGQAGLTNGEHANGLKLAVRRMSLTYGMTKKLQYHQRISTKYNQLVARCGANSLKSPQLGNNSSDLRKRNFSLAYE